MNISEFRTYIKSNYKRTSSFVTGTALAISDAITILLAVGMGFFLVNLVDHSLINFRSFITYWSYIPLIMLVFYAAKLYPGIMLAPSQEIKNIGICLFFCFAGIAFSITIESEDRVAMDQMNHTLQILIDLVNASRKQHSDGIAEQLAKPPPIQTHRQHPARRQYPPLGTCPRPM